MHDIDAPVFIMKCWPNCPITGCTERIIMFWVPGSSTRKCLWHLNGSTKRILTSFGWSTQFRIRLMRLSIVALTLSLRKTMEKYSLRRGKPNNLNALLLKIVRIRRGISIIGLHLPRRTIVSWATMGLLFAKLWTLLILRLNGLLGKPVTPQ